ncbi:MAG: RNA methyltransferase [Bacteroidaceae bacterium]|nr:RNA methyltransferase [Bacteroidaceae bacterium]
MLTKSTYKLIRSLDTRKGRREEGLFVAEGHKLVGELLGHFPCVALYHTDSPALHTLLQEASDLSDWVTGIERVTETEMERASLQQSPQGVLALFRIPQRDEDPSALISNRLCIALDGVQDPGNLGTIIRLADWFGIEDVFCSMDTCDVWNPKAVQATMGGIARVRVHYLFLPDLIASLPSEVPVYGTSLHGQSFWDAPLEQRGLLVMGNEGKGVTAEVAALCRTQLLIPNYPMGNVTTESLNVAMATGIILAEFRRRTA